MGGRGHESGLQNYCGTYEIDGVFQGVGLREPER